MMNERKQPEGREQLEQTIAALEAQRAVLGDEVVETALVPLREKLAALEHAAGPAEERQLVTILFADVSGFTALSERLDAEDVQDLLRQLWPRLDQTILRHGGHIDKHLGDGVMAVWGLERPREDDPAQAIRAALAMQAELTAFCQEQGVPLAMRTGLNTGLASIAHIPSTGERNVIGDTVNLAARLEQAAPPHGVLVSQSTYDRVRGLLDVEAQPPLAVKGKAQSVQTYLIAREKPRAFHMPTRGLAGITTRTVGRDVELGILQEAYQRARTGAGVQWVTVSGEAGVGKSRLLTEFEHWLELRPERIWYLKGRAWPQTERTPYYLLRDLLSFRFQIRDSDPLAMAQGKLTAGLSAVLDDELGTEAAAFIGQLAGFDFRQSQWIAYIAEDTRQIRDRAEVLLRKYLTRLCDTGLVVLLLEDLHWADEESLTLLSAILSEPHPWRLCAVGLTRRRFWERGVRWGQTADGEPVAYHRRLDLQPLPDDLAQELVRELLQRLEKPPEWLVELLVERSGGNPYFAEELVHWLIEQGVIETGPDMQSAWQIHQEQSVGLSVPGTVQGVLQARLERLEPTDRATLQRAAVVGRVFWDGAVAYIEQGMVPPKRWDRLQQRDLVFQQPMSQLPGEKEYHFKHILLRDVVYEYTLKKLRRVFHRRAAEWLARVAAERADEWAAVIAVHYEQAGDKTAAEWYWRAGKQAQATYAPEAAIGYYQKAIEFLPKGMEHAAWLVELYDGLGTTLRWQARFAEAAEAYTAMRAVAEAVRDMRALARTWDGLCWVQDSQGDHRTALASAEQAEEIARAAGAQAELAMALFRKGWAFYRLGDAETALALGEQALALSTELNARREMPFSLNLLGAGYLLLGRYEQATQYMEKALALFRELGNRRAVGIMLNNLGEVAQLRGDYRAAITFYQDALAISREIGNRDLELISLRNLSGARIGLREYRIAETDLRRIVRLTESAEWLSKAYGFLAEACLGQEKVVDALAAAKQALLSSQETESQENIGTAWRVLGMVTAKLPEPITIEGSPLYYDAAMCFAESLRVFTETGMEGERARTLREWARYEMERGDGERGKTMWQEALEIFERLGMELEVERMNDSA